MPPTATRIDAAPAAPDVREAPRTVDTAQPELAAAIARLRTRGAGTHELTVSLHPVELGAVQVRATLHDGALTVTVSCADDGARQAVTAALPDLHRTLGAATVDVRVGTDAPPSGSQPGPPGSQLGSQLGGHPGGHLGGHAAGQAAAQSGGDGRDRPAAGRPDPRPDRRSTAGSGTPTPVPTRVRASGLDRWM